ncbi:MAG TPA: hypothetical protein DEA55_08565 [Rhodospirillaceae bacterium]|nr:hypothetical protein [Rhodospirillaceae bacterium]
MGIMRNAWERYKLAIAEADRGTEIEYLLCQRDDALQGGLYRSFYIEEIADYSNEHWVPFENEQVQRGYIRAYDRMLAELGVNDPLDYVRKNYAPEHIIRRMVEDRAAEEERKMRDEKGKILGIDPGLTNTFGVVGGYKFSDEEINVLRAVHHMQSAPVVNYNAPEMNGQK